MKIVGVQDLIVDELYIDEEGAGDMQGSTQSVFVGELIYDVDRILY